MTYEESKLKRKRRVKGIKLGGKKKEERKLKSRRVREGDRKLRNGGREKSHGGKERVSF